MDRESYRHYFEVLELPVEADSSEVRNAYLLLKEIYSTESIATMSMVEEMSDEGRGRILEEVEEAYQALVSLFNEEQLDATRYVDEIIAGITVFDGPALKMIREKLKMALDDVAMATRIQQSHLVNIEEENFASLPVPVYTRGFVANYAKFLGVDPEMVAASYMEKFLLWKKEQE